MVMIRDFMAMIMIGMYQVNDVFMRVSVLLDLGLMVCNDFGECHKVVGHRTGVCRQHDAKRQGDGKNASEISRDFPFHPA